MTRRLLATCAVVGAMTAAPPLARAAVQNVPCANPFVFTGADVNVVVLPFSAPDEVRVPGGIGEQLGMLVQREVMLAIVKYGRVGSVQLTGRPEQGCTPDEVLAKLVGERPGAEAQVRPGAGLVLVWGRIYAAGDHLYLQTYVRFLRRGVDETIEVPVGGVRLVARPSAQAFACVPRRIEIEDLRRIHEAAGRQALVHDTPASAGPRPLPNDGAFSYYVLETRGEWMRIREHTGNIEGWIRATAGSDTWMLRGRMAELWFIEGAVAYLMARVQNDAPARSTAALLSAADRTMEAYRAEWTRGAVEPAAAQSQAGALALGLPAQMRALMRLAYTSAGLPGEAVTYAEAALGRLAWSADARNLHAVARFVSSGGASAGAAAPAARVQRLRTALDELREALSLEPTNALVLHNLEVLTDAALVATRTALQQKGSNPPPETPVTRELGRQLEAIKRLRAKAPPAGG